MLCPRADFRNAGPEKRLRLLLYRYSLALPVCCLSGPSRVVRRLMMRRRVLDLFHAGPREDESEASASGPSMTDLGALLRAVSWREQAD